MLSKELNDVYYRSSEVDVLNKIKEVYQNRYNFDYLDNGKVSMYKCVNFHPIPGIVYQYVGDNCRNVVLYCVNMHRWACTTKETLVKIHNTTVNKRYQFVTEEIRDNRTNKDKRESSEILWTNI